jgi:hypothetical protein
MYEQFQLTGIAKMLPYLFYWGVDNNYHIRCRFAFGRPSCGAELTDAEPEFQVERRYICLDCMHRYYWFLYTAGYEVN